jgi:hypothetical protein
MKYKLIIESDLLIPLFKQALSKSILFLDDTYQSIKIKELLGYICMTYKHAIRVNSD